MCTNISIPLNGQTGNLFSARTMDFGIPFKTVLKKFAVNDALPNGPQPSLYPLKWNAKIGFIAVVMEITEEGISTPVPGVWDGMNSEGLSVATLWLPGSEYPKLKLEDKNRLWPVYVPAWVLSNFKTIDEVEKEIDSIHIEKIPFKGDKLGYHFMIQDTKGGCLLIEFKDGQVIKTRTTDGLGGILTNAPFYDEQLANLKRYEKLTPENTLIQYGQETNGSGMLGKEGEYPGLPGDATPPSRFVRTAKMCLSPFVPTPNNPNIKDPGIDVTRQAVGFAWQLLQTVWVPYGTITKKGHPDQLADYTQWAVIRDYVNKHYYFYSAFNPTLHRIELDKVDFTTSDHSAVPIASDDWYSDATNKF